MHDTVHDTLTPGTSLSKQALTTATDVCAYLHQVRPIIDLPGSYIPGELPGSWA